MTKPKSIFEVIYFGKEESKESSKEEEEINFSYLINNRDGFFVVFLYFFRFLFWFSMIL